MSRAHVAEWDRQAQAALERSRARRAVDAERDRRSLRPRSPRDLLVALAIVALISVLVTALYLFGEVLAAIQPETAAGGVAPLLPAALRRRVERAAGG